MIVGVVGNRVSLVHLSLDDIWVEASITADDKKRGVCLKVGQQIQELGRPFLVGAIVKGEIDHLVPGDARNEKYLAGYRRGAETQPVIVDQIR